ncbi:MAG: ABC transporter ATP-binding protein [Bacteroidia bacterium]|nr:ABC transporter ATP-binding protein [Bacteroidia bacterium]
MLVIEGITKSFIQRGIVLDKLELSVKEGDSIAVTGSSGSGKTTLMNIIGLLDKPDSGDLFFRGKSILTFTPDESALYRNRNIGFIFQDNLLLPHLTVEENIMLPLFAARISEDEYKEKRKYADLLMEKTGIKGLYGKYPFQISGGEAQRVTLVRALINKPSLLLADEPTGSLDAKNAMLLGELLTSLNNETGTAMIVATHSSDLAAKMKVHLRLENGRLIP